MYICSVSLIMITQVMADLSELEKALAAFKSVVERDPSLRMPVNTASANSAAGTPAHSSTATTGAQNSASGIVNGAAVANATATAAAARLQRTLSSSSNNAHNSSSGNAQSNSTNGNSNGNSLSNSASNSLSNSANGAVLSSSASTGHLLDFENPSPLPSPQAREGLQAQTTTPSHRYACHSLSSHKLHPLQIKNMDMLQYVWVCCPHTAS